MFTLMFAGLVGKLFRMQILDGSDYQKKYMQKTERSVDTPGTRGKIYDCNGFELAYNKLAYSVVIQDTGDYPKTADRNQMLHRDRKSTRLNSSHSAKSRMPSSA